MFEAVRNKYLPSHRWLAHHYSAFERWCLLRDHPRPAHHLTRSLAVMDGKVPTWVKITTLLTRSRHSPRHFVGIINFSPACAMVCVGMRCWGKEEKPEGGLKFYVQLFVFIKWALNGSAHFRKCHWVCSVVPGERCSLVFDGGGQGTEMLSSE